METEVSTVEIELSKGFTLEFSSIPLPPTWDSSIKSYNVSKYAVTQELYLAYSQNEKELKFYYTHKDRGDGERVKNPHAPVSYLSYNNVKEFYANIGSECGNFQFRLPTSEEWMYYSRAGSTQRYVAGEAPQDLSKIALLADDWMHGVVSMAFTGKHFPYSLPDISVGQKEPNNWGIFDTFGLLEETVLDGQEFRGRGGDLFSYTEKFREDWNPLVSDNFLLSLHEEPIKAKKNQILYPSDFFGRLAMFRLIGIETH